MPACISTFATRMTWPTQMRCVLADPDEVERLRRCARERAETSYSWDSITDEYESYFASLLNGKLTRASGAAPG